jgi:hypothetical protein
MVNAFEGGKNLFAVGDDDNCSTKLLRQCCMQSFFDTAARNLLFGLRSVFIVLTNGT